MKCWVFKNNADESKRSFRCYDNATWITQMQYATFVWVKYPMEIRKLQSLGPSEESYCYHLVITSFCVKYLLKIKCTDLNCKIQSVQQM